MTWRVGGNVGRTIYAQVGDAPSRRDPLIGVMDTPELADMVVRAVNAYPRGVPVTEQPVTPQSPGAEPTDPAPPVTTDPPTDPPAPTHPETDDDPDASGQDAQVANTDDTPDEADGPQDVEQAPIAEADVTPDST